MSRETKKGDVDFLKNQTAYENSQNYIMKNITLREDESLVFIEGLISFIGSEQIDFMQNISNGETMTISIITRIGEQYFSQDATINNEGLMLINEKTEVTDLHRIAGDILHSDLVGNVQESIKVLNKYFKTDTYTEKFMEDYAYYIEHKDNIAEVEKITESIPSFLDEIGDIGSSLDELDLNFDFNEEDLFAEIDESSFETTEDIVKKILKDKNLSEESLEYIIDYMTQIKELNLLPDSVDITTLINRTNSRINNIILFDEEHPINYFGHDFRGYTSSDEKTKLDNGYTIPENTLFIRKSREDAEIIFYHELTHLLQQHTNGTTGLEFFNAEGNERGNLGNEVQVQYIADLIYARKHKRELSDKEYDSGELRMLPGTTIKSVLTNYQHFENLFDNYLNATGRNIEDAIKAAFSTQEKVIDFWYSPSNIDNNKVLTDMERIYVTDKFAYTGKMFVNGETYPGQMYLEVYNELGKTLSIKQGKENFDVSLANEIQTYLDLMNEFNQEKQHPMIKSAVQATMKTTREGSINNQSIQIINEVEQQNNLEQQEEKIDYN